MRLLEAVIDTLPVDEKIRQAISGFYFKVFVSA
jgi:hypothetical protein